MEVLFTFFVIVELVEKQQKGVWERQTMRSSNICARMRREMLFVIFSLEMNRF